MRGRIAFKTDVPKHIALLRDGLIAAFLRGDLDKHACLTQQLKAALDASSFFVSFPVDPAKVKFESGTLNLLAPAE